MQKKFLGFLVILIGLLCIPLNGQSSKYGWLAQSSWNFGFGGIYPKYISTSGTSTEGKSFGGYLSLERNFSEHVGLRLKGSFLHLVTRTNVDFKNNSGAADFDLMYYLVPCEPVSPYLFSGFGAVYFTLKNSPFPELNDSFWDFEFNLGIGAEFSIGENLKLNTEFGYHIPATTKFDGIYSTDQGTLLGGSFDSYGIFSLGLNYYFGYGEKSSLCQDYQGLSGVDYNKIEEIIKKYQTEPVKVDYNKIEEIVKNNQPKVSTSSEQKKWVLIGVNFDFNSSKLKPESMPILYNAAEILLTNPNINIEIQGHTDDIGSEEANLNLSTDRAETVKNFLVAKGVNENRITTRGLGESQPIMSNDTTEGRELNRRIEFVLK
ncbi:MAG TPA: OmpA family protein [Ignavibacteriaceae bacterium]|nr:OmpA family protein [Ignavibacteriaceae bacterium]